MSQTTWIAITIRQFGRYVCTDLLDESDELNLEIPFL